MSSTMGVPYHYLTLWGEYKHLSDMLLFEWEEFGWIMDELYFQYLEAERRWMEATGR